MFRKELAEKIRNRPTAVKEIARAVRRTPKEIAEDLEHLAKSLKRTDEHIRVKPATCRKCQFEFSETTYHRPSKCPECKGTWLSDPLVWIEAKE